MKAENERRVSLLIVDDHPVVRDGLTGMFSGDPGFTVLGQAGDGAHAIAAVTALDPDVVLMDLRMPGMDGLAAITELTRREVRSRILVLTTYDTDSDVIPAIQAGATGYLLKDAPRDELLAAVRACAAGEGPLSPPIAGILMNRLRSPRPAATAPEIAAPAGATQPSQRELAVLRLIASGRNNRQAAAELFISEATVKTHLLNMYTKLGVNDRATAVAAAYNRGLLTPETRSPTQNDQP